MSILMLIALLICIFGIVRAFAQRGDIQKASLALTATFSLAISVLVFPYYRIGNDLLIAVIDAFRAGVSGIALSVNGDIPYDLELAGRQFVLYRFFLYSLYVLGPLAGSLFLLTLSANVKNALSLFGKKNIYVFSCLNEKSMAIGESIYEKDRSARVIYCECEDVPLELSNRVRSIHGVMVSVSQNKLPLRKNRNYEFFEVHEDDEERIISVSDLCEALPAKKNFDDERIIIRIFSDDRQRELLLNIDERYSDLLYLRHVNENNSLAIHALSLCMDVLAVKQDLHVGVVCDDELGISFLKNLICLSIKPEGKQRFTLAGPKATRLYEDFLKEAPEASCYPVKVQNCDYGNEAEAFEKDDIPDAVFVLYEDGVTSHSCAMSLRRALSSYDDNLSAGRIYAYVKDPALHKIIKEKDIVLFGNIEEMCGYDSLINPDLEKAAQRVHLSYLKKSEEDLKEDKDLLENSGFYEFQNQESSFAMALALKYKEKYILSFKKDKDCSDKEFIDAYLSDEKNLNTMAVAEHERWNAYERCHGWRVANEAQTKAIIEKYKGKRANDPKLKLHPAIVDYETLYKVEERVDELYKEYGSNRKSGYIAADKDIIKKLTYILDVH